MNKRFSPLAAFLALTVAVMACALPGSSGGEEPTTDQVATIVAGTLQAFTPPVSDAPTETPMPAGILPRSFYYIGGDASNVGQVFRIERDGVTVHQITFEPASVNAYDVSAVDGSVVYVANNQLLWVDANGSGRRILVDGGPIDVDTQFETSITSPAYTPDGQTIAYGLRGINLYTLATNSSSLVLPTAPADIALGRPAEMYIPKHYSPDGTKLLITIAIPNSDGITSGIFLPASGSIIRFSGEGGIFCCSEQGWTSDGSALYAANPNVGMFGSGLWRVDTTTGVMNTLLPAELGGELFNLPDEPYLAPDGQLYFFYSSASSPDGFINRPPLQIVRSALDGVTGRAALNPENFQLINEALWAPDASFVVIAFAPTQDVYQGGQAEVTYYDSRPPVILTTYAQQMKWGP